MIAMLIELSSSYLLNEIIDPVVMPYELKHELEQ